MISVSPYACVVFLQIFQLPPTVHMHARLICDSKLSVGINGCLSLCTSPITDLQPVQYVLPISPCDSWDRLQPCHDSELDKWKKMDG